MTTPIERTRAVLQTREFLQELTFGEHVPESVRRQAVTLLRHYPNASNMRLAHLGSPNWFGPPQDAAPADE